jgi:hypothetical protein
VLKTTRTIKISNCGSFLWAMPIWMEGHGCELAVRIDGKYFVDGTSSGDAHANDGFVLLSERHPLLAK